MSLGILRKLKLGMLVFGIMMGTVFPLYAGFFVEFRPGMKVWFGAGCIIAGLMVGIFAYKLVGWILLKQLMKLARGCREVANGNLDISVDIESRDAVGEIAQGFNAMSRALCETMEQLAAGIGKLSLVSENISSINSRLARMANDQELFVTQISVATHEASQTISSINGNLCATDQFSYHINENVTSTVSYLEGSMDKMEETSGAVQVAIKKMETLGGRSDKISEILLIINDIAEQTNLLALNAAIEAAHAGENGRGFAVVAEEVRKLAEKSANATREIGTMIKELQAGVAETIASVEHNAGIVGSMKEMLTNSSSAVKGIFDEVNSISDAIHQVSAATEEQSAVYSSIDKSMENIEQAFKEILELSQKGVTEDRKIVEVSNSLKAYVDRFRN
ncbi:MAG TPA: methyl-accepting chemotaxis protein [Thermodesulfovibrionales bacterium]|nr:methyl-accepting chemotaxis protein [Thermodesulfovibrionales bacterium]